MSLRTTLLRGAWLACTILTLLQGGGCHRDMYDQPRLEPMEHSSFFEDGAGSRPLVQGTVARGRLMLEDAYHTGKENGQPVAELPPEILATLGKDGEIEATKMQAFLDRGRERYDIFCSVCHGQSGYGDGMIVRRGYRRPPSYHIDRLRGIEIGHYFDVITHGFGVMPPYATRISIDDRWAIAAYIRALQLSQFAEQEQLNNNDRQEIEQAAAVTQTAAAADHE